MSAPLLVFGAGGQLGQEVLTLAARQGLEAVGCRRARADITDFKAIEAVMKAVSPRLVLNAAAYTAVDRAESEPEAAFAANVTGAENIARAAAAQDVPVIHISTDYVFDGTKTSAYVESDPVAPLGVYGRTKADGEARVRAVNARHFILRTSWVYGQFGANFLKTILRLARERDELRIVADQHGCPTATEDLAEAIFAIDHACASGHDVFGTYHFAGQGATSWHGFASVIAAAQAQLTGRCPKVLPITTADYPTPARRPANSELDSSLFASVFGYRAQSWQSRAKATVEILLRDMRVEP
jgi:dTDP-4-dehydrorhamnose reductase